ncbi:conserved phage C-terminal domain-containing protein [Brochothrix thermosphacta]|uniref:conserved phage C-terminal domain-containing protein n=1 Tax=Brochothrix thermosphacta TaxID=2756 RepID=UPI00083F7BEB|nr:conserved phage C-terminal domain-containing protein [Brochothrix thermosphacta]ODJ54823.1 DNA replication protein [Brochothrix thermosphacta]ODJ66929.1 DNA replication protein [Brochothrix thermosphacta]
MAQRRMFSKDITTSDIFVDMPMSSQLLYFHLGMEADDEGFIGNAKMLSRAYGSNNDDLMLLKAKGFIIMFDSGVSVVKDWNLNNRIRKDRIKETIYRSEKSLLTVDSLGVYQIDNQTTTKCQPNDNQMSAQYRLGKVRLGKVSKDIVPQSETVPPYKTIIDYLNDKAGTKYRSSSKDTQKHIKARFNNGFTLEDFKTVIDNKVFEWGNNSKMSVYLRPKTLFGTKFEDYLNQKGGGESAIFSEDDNKFSNAPVTDDDTLPF